MTIFGPAHMAPALVERISKAVQDALADANVKARIQKMGMEAKSSTPQDRCSTFMAAERALMPFIATASADWPGS